MNEMQTTIPDEMARAADRDRKLFGKCYFCFGQDGKPVHVPVQSVRIVPDSDWRNEWLLSEAK